MYHGDYYLKPETKDAVRRPRNNSMGRPMFTTSSTKITETLIVLPEHSSESPKAYDQTREGPNRHPVGKVLILVSHAQATLTSAYDRTHAGHATSIRFTRHVRSQRAKEKPIRKQVAPVICPFLPELKSPGSVISCTSSNGKFQRCRHPKEPSALDDENMLMALSFLIQSHMRDVVV